MQNVDVTKKMDEFENKTGKAIDSILLLPIEANNKLLAETTKPIQPVIRNAEAMKQNLDKLNEKIRSDLTRILFTTRHKNLFEALVADIVDTLPGLGDVTEAERLADARRIGDRDAVVAHGIDTVSGEIFDVIPVAGEMMDSILDALLPANTLLYLKRRGLIEWNPPAPPLPKIK